MCSERKKIIRLLGVGFDTDDHHVRITSGDEYDVIMGSEESHAFIQDLIGDIMKEIERRGLSLDDLSPSQLSEIVQTCQNS